MDLTERVFDAEMGELDQTIDEKLLKLNLHLKLDSMRLVRGEQEKTAYYRELMDVFRVQSYHCWRYSADC